MCVFNKLIEISNATEVDIDLLDQVGYYFNIQAAKYQKLKADLDNLKAKYTKPRRQTTYSEINEKTGIGEHLPCTCL